VTPEPQPSGQRKLAVARLLIRMLSVAIPRHRREEWREEWEAELIGRFLESNARCRQSNTDLYAKVLAAIPDAVHIVTREWVLDVLVHDLRHSLRALSKHKAFCLVAVLTIALCMTVNSVIFPVVNAIVLRPLPYPDSDRILTVYNSYPEAQEDRAGNSIPDYFDRRENIAAFEDVGLYSLGGSIIGDGESSRHAFRIDLTPSLFRVLGARPHVGRLLEEEDAEPGNHLKVVISYALWQSQLGGETGAIGQDLIIGEVPYTVVGVLDEPFRFPTWEASIWTPLAFGPERRADGNRYSGGPEMLAKLRPGNTVELAREQIDALNTATLERYPPDIQNLVRESGFRTEVLPFHDDLIKDVRTPLLLLWGGVLFVLLIGCVNIANLLLVWTSSRSRDFAVRHALGAGRFRVTRQIVTESVSLSAIGGGLGLVIGAWSMRLLESFEVYDVPRMAEVHMDLAAVGVTLGLALVVGVVAGIAPALRMLRGDLSATVTSGGRAPTSVKRSVTLRSVLVSTQIAVTFILTIGAGLMFATMRNVLAVDPGFNPTKVLGAAVTLPGDRYSDVASRTQFIDAAVEELRAQPAIEDAAMVSHLPFSGVGNTRVVTPEVMEEGGNGPVFTSETYFVSPTYFDVLGIPITQGRSFTRNDRVDGAPVAIIDEWLAERYWPDTNAIGARVSLTAHVEDDQASDWFTIVGVVGSVSHNDLTSFDHTGALYRPHGQAGLSFFRLAVKTLGDPVAATPDLRRAISRVDNSITPFWTVALEDRVAASLIPRRTPMQLLLISAGVGLLLATLGVYGVLAYSVNQRTREIGIRMALGGTAKQIVQLVGRQWLRVVGVGLLFGLAGALVLTRLIVGLLFQVTPTDPIVLLGSLLVLAIVASVAYLIPAWRAVRVEPSQVLNSE
jgi:predicted permease